MSLFNRTPGSPSIPAPAFSQAQSPAQAKAQAQSGGSGLVPLTEDDLKKALPSTMRTAVTQSLVDLVNGISADPLMAQNIRDNIVSYSTIMKEGKFKTEDYIHAVSYCSYKLMGLSNQDAYTKTFPQRHATLVARGAASKDIAAYVAAYHKGKLVNLIMEQSMVPTWVLNQDAFQQAINTQVDLMKNATSELVRTQAANSILTHLKKPEAVKGQLQIDVSEVAGMKEMKDLLTKLATAQRDAIVAGELKTIDVAASKLIDKDQAEDIGDE